jgi:hypothetical protein
MRVYGFRLKSFDLIIGLFYKDRCSLFFLGSLNSFDHMNYFENVNELNLLYIRIYNIV